MNGNVWGPQPAVAPAIRDLPRLEPDRDHHELRRGLERDHGLDLGL